MILGLNGVAKSGKDTVGGFLVKNHGFKQIAFADRMREMAFAIDPIVDYVTDGVVEYGSTDVQTIVSPVRFSDLVLDVGYDASKKNPEVRGFLQRLGTEAGRQVWGDSFWTDVVRATIVSEPGTDWVVSDVRFPNEVDTLLDLGGFVAHIERPGVAAANGHISEHALGEQAWDYEILNDGTLLDLEVAAKEMVEQLRG